MKKIYLLIAFVLFGIGAFAQCSVLVATSTNTTCFGSCNGTVTVTTVGVSPFTYTWAPGGQTVQNPTNLCAGTHTVTMTDANSCVSSTTVIITQPTLLQDSSHHTNIASCDSCNGTATAFAYGGTGSYTHKWTTTPVQTSATATGLCPGTYRDTIKDANNCQTVLSVTITQAAALAVTTSITNTSSSTACDGGITATPSGGTSPFTYAWMPGGQTTASIIGQCPGNYTVCITDANGCTTCDGTNLIGVTGINELSITKMIHLSPNPSTGPFMIFFDQPIINSSVSITNVIGEEIFRSPITSQKIEIDLSSQPNGTYLVSVKTEEGMVAKRMIIQK